MDLRATLQTLASQPYTEHPFLSLYLDWVPDGSGKRQAPRIVEQELNRIADRVNEHGVARASFNADRQRIMDYLARDAPDGARGLAIFACDAGGIWITLPLHAGVETEIAEDRYPHLFTLARVLATYEPYAVVLADGQESRIFVVALDSTEQVGKTEAPEHIKRFKSGKAQENYLLQHRADNIIKAHAKDIAEQLGQVMARYDARHVVIAANDAIKGIVMDALPDAIKERLVDYVHLNSAANIRTIVDEIGPRIRQVEREQEAAAVAELEEQTYPDGLGVVGIADTALALSKGQARMLIVRRNFKSAGSECSYCGSLRAGGRQRCPYDGAQMRPVQLRELFTARAIQQNAEIEIIEAGDYLDQHEGVGVLLRYRNRERTAENRG